MLFTPAPGADEPGHPGHLLRPGRRGAAPPPTCSTASHDAYDDEPFVVVTDGSPSTKATLGSNVAHLTARYDDRTGTVVAIGAIDNLVKGTAGQAMQCVNLMVGLPEATGLPIAGVYP